MARYAPEKRYEQQGSTRGKQKAIHVTLGRVINNERWENFFLEKTRRKIF
jgi:hypothetical protein